MLHRSIPMNVDAPAGGWETHLAPVVLAIGTPRFVHRLHSAVGQLVRACHFTIVEFSPALKPSVFLISSTREEERAEQAARAYFEEYYKDDPNYVGLDRLVTRDSVAIVRRDLNELGPSYRHRFYEKQSIVDKVSILYETNGTLVTSNIYKDADEGEFTGHEIETIAALAPLISAAASRHCQLLSLARIDLDMIVYAMAVRRAISLTAREMDVCQGILRGQSAEAIALSLGIAPSSVITHRKNLYRKFNIVSQAELFSRAFDTVAGTA